MPNFSVGVIDVAMSKSYIFWDGNGTSVVLVLGEKTMVLPRHTIA
jgi:hypothetical protein